MSGRSAISAGPISTTRAASRSRRPSATRSRPPILENVAEGPDAERAFERLAREGCKLIFGTSFGFMDPMKVAGEFPDVKFEHATGFKTSDNLAIYNARFYEGRYVSARSPPVSKTGLAGYIVSFPIPEVVMGINSFMLGAQSVDPDFKVRSYG